MPRLIRKEIEKIQGYSLKNYPHQVKLNQNESPYDLPVGLKNKVIRRLWEVSWNRYPTPFCDPLCQMIAAREEWREGGIVISDGSNVLIQAIMIAGSVGGRVMTITPSFALYEIEGSILGNRVIQVPLNREDFSLPRDLFLKRLKKEKPNIVFLANPNAPTGNLFPEENLLAIIRAAPGLVVIDEAYYPFSGMTLRRHLNKYKNLILLRTFSKAFSLGGVRLGYLLADPKIAGEIRKVILPFSVGVMSQVVGEVVLESDSYLEPLVKRVVKERDFVYRKLEQVGARSLRPRKGGETPSLQVYRSDANFILFQSPQYKKIFKNLLAQGILIRDVSSSDLPNALRVTIGTPKENRRFLGSIEKGLI